MKAIVFGGTSGMGRAIARRLVERGDTVFLLGNEEEELARSAADLKAHHPAGAPGVEPGAREVFRPLWFPCLILTFWCAGTTLAVLRHLRRKSIF